MHSIILMVVFILAIPLLGICQNKVVRDRNGRIIETWSTQGSGQTVVRDRNGSIIEQRQRDDNHVVVRDRNGRILRSETYER